jgi:ankyrin repeat protein
MGGKKPDPTRVMRLVASGASAWAYGWDGVSPLHVAAMHNRPSVIHELLKHEPRFSRRALRVNPSTQK